MSMGSVIAGNRKKKNLSQEQLAKFLEVTNQAVSKWESDQCCPDIQLLPRLADLFEISVDALFERSQVQEPVVTGLPWENDETLRAVLYVGHTLVGHGGISQHPAQKEITFCYEGPALNVDSDFSVQCGNVSGNVDAGCNVNCGNVGGSVDAGCGVTCGDVAGDVDAGTDVTCTAVSGDVDAGFGVTIRS